jgi:glutathione S-transferase
VPKVTRLVRSTFLAVRKHMEKLNNESLADGRPYLVGDKYTLADVGMTAIFERIDNVGASHLYADQPRVVEYWQKVKSRPSYKQAIQDEELAIIARGRQQVAKWKEEWPDWKALYEETA